ncbi:MAG: hypothetical protein ABI691_05415 [Ginsengibacter sp.]
MLTLVFIILLSTVPALPNLKVPFASSFAEGVEVPAPNLPSLSTALNTVLDEFLHSVRLAVCDPEWAWIPRGTLAVLKPIKQNLLSAF